MSERVCGIPELLLPEQFYAVTIDDLPKNTQIIADAITAIRPHYEVHQAVSSYDGIKHALKGGKRNVPADMVLLDDQLYNNWKVWNFNPDQLAKIDSRLQILEENTFISGTCGPHIAIALRILGYQGPIYLVSSGPSPPIDIKSMLVHWEKLGFTLEKFPITGAISKSSSKSPNAAFVFSTERDDILWKWSPIISGHYGAIFPGLIANGS